MQGKIRYIGKHLACALLLCAATFSRASAQTADSAEDSAQQVVVAGARKDPEKMSYAKFLEALDYFEKNHTEAPSAVLKFRLVPTHQFDVSSLTVKIKAGNEVIPLTLDPDLTFAIPRIERLRDKDAYVVVNKNSDNFVWRTYVQTPGLPPDQRRLGDLRVECRINFKSGLERFMGPGGPIVGPLYATKMDDPCYAPTIDYPTFFTFRPVFNVTISDGSKQLTLKTKYLWRSGSQDVVVALPFVTNFIRTYSYAPPVRDGSWSNDSMLSFEFMDDASHDNAAINR